MMASEQPQSRRFLIFLLISTLVHIGLFLVLFFGPKYLLLNELNKRLSHTIENKTEDLVTQIELINNEELNKQIVEQSDKSINEVAPKEADYLSATNQTVEKQTKARNNGKFNNSNSSGINQISIGKKSEKIQENQSVKNLGLNGLPLSSETHKENQENRPTLVSLGEGLSQTDDFLENIDEGDQTVLNTKEFIYYSYFMRVKDQLRSHWNPMIRKNVQVLYAKDRNIANLNVKATSVRITLNKSGYLEKIELLKTSGYEELDIAAIQAFRSAAPFLNPPIGLLEKDKRIRIVWDFILES